MPITLPNLDDRRYSDLVNEARALIPTYAPVWTNHNPSDPGITLIEMFAYVTEMLIYRLNRVTDTNIFAFLKLIDGWDRSLGPGGVVVKTKEGSVTRTSPSLTDDVRGVVLELRTLDRAVTTADFEELLLRDFPGRVLRVRCVADRNIESEDPTSVGVFKPGHISVIVVPGPGDQDKSNSAPKGALIPAAALIHEVLLYLEPRRLLTTRVHVVGPRYVSVGVQLTLHLKPDSKADTVGPRAVEALRKFLDPIEGGRDQTGWPFGRNVYLSEIYELLDKVNGVDHVQPSVAQDTGALLDELVVQDPLRLVRRAPGSEMIAVDLFPDELVSASIDGYRLGDNEKTVSIITSLAH